ncbi:ATP-binding protein [Nocardia sp. 004]|uniref:ATP-binding protein n=1 Tax=Nocardia sp. 004 TaxID=3385978 RepID=UPI00399FF702
MSSERSGPPGHSRVLTTPAGELVVVALLGEIALRRDGVLTPLPGARARLLLAALALRPGRSRSVQALIEDIWAQQPPRAPINALHTQVSRLRSALPEGVLEIGPAGYRLALTAEQVDVTSVGAQIRLARRCRDTGDLAGCLAAVERARALWRGEAGADLPQGGLADDLHAVAGRHLAELDEIELSARADSGDIDGALRVAHRRAAADPLDECAQQTLMRLFTAAGRANEALASFADFRSRLVERLGTDPGPALTATHTAILRGEPLHHTGTVPRSDPGGAVAVATATGFGSGFPVRSDDDIAAAQPQAMAIGLRAAPNALLGRVADLAALTDLLSESRVVTVLGPGGVGKTRVANEIGARVAGSRPVALVELASVRAESGEARVEVEAVIAATLGLREVTLDSATLRSGQTSDIRRRLHDAVSARSMVLILDNCEHLIDAVAVVVADLISVASRLTVLTTSRSPLEITAETVYPLLPLTIDSADSPATELFTARARAVRPGVRLNPAVVDQLCHTLDGLPLAIELAAARVRVMSVEEINAGLSDRFALLRHGDRSSPDRHRTLHAVIDWSWHLLDYQQQVALRRLCRFPAGFTLSAAEVMMGGGGTAVDGLVNQSLLTMLDDEALGTRYRMLETVREFGEEQLAAVGESELSDTRIMRWAEDYAADAVRRYRTGDQLHLALSVAAELDNLVAALRCAVERPDAATAYTVFPVVAMLWLMRGSHLEVVAWAERVIALDPAGSGPARPHSESVLITYQMTFIHFAFGSRGVGELARLRSKVRRLLRSRTDLTESGRFLGRVMLSRPDGRGLARLIAEAIRSTDPETRATALTLRANIRENLGDVHGATVDATEALAGFGSDSVWSQAMVSRHLGQICGQTARYAESVAHYRQALELLQRLGAYEDIVETRSMLVASLVGSGELEQALDELDLASVAADMDGSIDGQNRLLGVVMLSSAEVALATGDITGGFARYQRALELFGWPDDALGPGFSALALAAAALDAKVLYGAADAGATLAAQLAERAVPVLTQYRDLPQIGTIACALGSYLVAADRDIARGLELLALAPNVFCRQDFPSMRWERHLDIARATLGADRVAEVLDRVGRLRRRASADRIMEMIRELNDC